MTAPDSKPSPDASDDEEFAAFVADLATHAHDPTEEGDLCRELLADDPERLREAWALSHIATAGLDLQPSVPLLIVGLVVVAGLSAALTMWVAS